MDNLINLFQSNIKLTTFASRAWLDNSPEYLREDILAEARVGLWKACKTFNPSLGFTFSTYAARVIFNQVGMYMRKQRKYSSMISLDSAIEGVEETFTLMSSLGCEHDFDSELNTKSIITKLNNYPILKRLVTGEKQKDVAESVGLSQAQISRIYRKERELLAAEL